jgi:hypothetical protein
MKLILKHVFEMCFEVYFRECFKHVSKRILTQARFIRNLSVTLILIFHISIVMACCVRLTERSSRDKHFWISTDSVTPKNKKDFLDYIGRVRVINSAYFMEVLEWQVKSILQT